VLTETADTIHEILIACPHIQVIATSREVLDIPGEVRFSVPPLLDSEAISLFTDRARTALPSFELTEGNASRVAQICSRLDGIPLAIELAASRLSAMSVDQIASVLDDRFDLLTTGSRFTLPRQQTLRAAIDWSYDLLAEEDKTAFRSLSVFAGGFDLEAASSVLGSSSNVLDAIARLADKSLLVVDRQPNGEARYRLLESMREYCGEKLHEAGEEPVIREKHLQYFLSFAEEGDVKLRGKEQLEWIKRLEREQDNFRGALTFTLEGDSPELAESGLRLALALNFFWYTRGYRQERRDWIGRLKALPHQPRATPYYARALGLLANWTRDREQAREMLDEDLSLCEALGNKSSLAAAHFDAAMLYWGEDDPSVGRAHFEQSIAIYRELGEKWRLGRMLAELGEFAQVRQDDRITARTSFEESLDLSRELGDTRGIAFALIRLGDLLIEQNLLVEARQYL
jgi:predicted ATPase